MLFLKRIYSKTILYFKNFTVFAFWLILTVFLFVGGLGIEKIWIPWGLTVFTSVTLLILIYVRKVLSLPRYYIFYFLFIGLMAVSILWSKNSYNSTTYILLFLSGGLLWLTIYNLNLINNKTGAIVEKIFSLLGIVWGTWFIVEKLLGNRSIGSFGLVKYASASFNHHHVGDFFVPIVLVAIFNLLEGCFVRSPERKKQLKVVGFWLLITIAGALIVFTSLSRSAYLALLVGILFMSGNYVNKTYGKMLFISFLVVIAVFLFVGGEKSLVFSRPYFVEGIIGFIRNPLGVGVGNFGIISGDPNNYIFGVSGYSSAAHNLILEFLDGMGVLGIIFPIWLSMTLVDLLKNKKDLLFKSIFLALTVNFMFDFTYAIPAMLWLWFISLGLTMI